MSYMFIPYIVEGDILGAISDSANLLGVAQLVYLCLD